MHSHSLTVGAHLLLWVFPLAVTALALAVAAATRSRGGGR